MTRLIENLVNDRRLGLKAGEVYEAALYTLDPGKVTLLARIPDGYDPQCNQYVKNIKPLPFWRDDERRK